MSSIHSTLHKSKFSLLNSNSSKNPLSQWPKGMSYLSWKKLSRYQFKFRRKANLHRRNKSKLLLKSKTIKEGIKNEKPENPFDFANKSTATGDFKLELITMLKAFLDRKNISEHIEKAIPDDRNPHLITYTKQSIMMCAIAIFLFRMSSGNKYNDKCRDKDETYSVKNMALFIKAPQNRVPVIKTIETFLKTLDERRVNDLMIAFFKELQQSKFFQHHPEIMPGDFYLLAADCVHNPHL